MKYASVTDRLAGLGSAKWALHLRARALKAQGRQIIELTIGEPDVPTPATLIETASQAMAAGRVGYSNGRGEPALLEALAKRYSARRGRSFTRENFICLPGTQTSLYAIFRTLVETGDEVLLGDPLYATYEGLIRQTGATPVAVPLRAEAGFRIQVDDIAARITPKTRVIFVNTPHNPTGAVLSRDELRALGDLAKAHDLWLVADEVYEELVFPGVSFASPLEFADLAERVVAAASISKSHSAPGFRSGWVIGSAEFTERLLPLSETMLFGSQPFIADMTAEAVGAPSPIASAMAARFAARAKIIHSQLHGQARLNVHMPEAGMFALIDIRATGLSGAAFAADLLERESVAVMPGESFGESLAGWLRVSLTQDDGLIEEACRRIRRHAETLLAAAA